MTDELDAPAGEPIGAEERDDAPGEECIAAEEREDAPGEQSIATAERPDAAEEPDATRSTAARKPPTPESDAGRRTPGGTPAGPEADAARARGDEARTIDGELARLHLRTGMLALARAELETLAGWSALDREALVDLAEVRWRTGDLIGAGEAAAAYLEVGGEEPLAFCVAAEAALAAGRKSDAEAYAARVLGRAADRLDDLFAGQPRSELWPAPLALPAPSARAATSLLSAPLAWPPQVGENEAAAPSAAVDGAGAPAVAAPGVRLSDGGAAPQARTGGRVAATAGSLAAAAQDELSGAERRLAVGDLGGLAPRLEIVLRLQPALAPAVLALADAALQGPAPPADDLAAIHLVRSEAGRLMGREGLSVAALQEARRLLHPGTPPPGTPAPDAPALDDASSAAIPPPDASSPDTPAPDTSSPDTPPQEPT